MIVNVWPPLGGVGGRWRVTPAEQAACRDLLPVLASLRDRVNAADPAQAGQLMEAALVAVDVVCSRHAITVPRRVGGAVTLGRLLLMLSHATPGPTFAVAWRRVVDLLRKAADGGQDAGSTEGGPAGTHDGGDRLAPGDR